MFWRQKKSRHVQNMNILKNPSQSINNTIDHLLKLHLAPHRSLHLPFYCWQTHPKRIWENRAIPRAPPVVPTMWGQSWVVECSPIELEAFSDHKPQLSGCNRPTYLVNYLSVDIIWIFLISWWPWGKLTQMWNTNGFLCTFMVDCHGLSTSMLVYIRLYTSAN